LDFALRISDFSIHNLQSTICNFYGPHVALSHVELSHVPVVLPPPDDDELLPPPPPQAVKLTAMSIAINN
jgi:hypothetical protein